jgi:phospholipase/lecithinase/hemolysin
MAYSGVYVFGDSLVDPGNALGLAEWYDGLPLQELPEGAPTEELGYFEGRFSNGYTFADLVANKAIGKVTEPIFPYHFEDPWLGLPIAPFADEPHINNSNWAYGGSHIIQGADEVVPDFDDQTDAFRDAMDGDAPSDALYLITLGGNDIRDLAPTGSSPILQSQAYAELQRCADEMIEEIGQLFADGARNFVITGIPDVGLIPRYDRDDNGVLDATEQLRSAAATDYSIRLDFLIRTQVVPALQALGATVTYVPLMDHVDGNGNLVEGALNANLPTIAALHGLTTEELTNNLLQHKDLVFFDHVHPNGQANALLGAFMQSMIAGTPWVETLPLTGADVDYRTTGTIAAAGEVDQLVIAMVAGTTYTFDMLGMSSLGVTGSLGDPSLKLLNAAGTLVASDDDSGAGFDASCTYAAAGTGNYTLQACAVGNVTGTYTLQAAVVSGAAMQAGNSYTVNNASTLVLEGAGGLGEDVVLAGTSYALSAGSEIEVLRTVNDRAKTAINLTGNEFDQLLIGNAGTNRLDGKGGADTLIGGDGKDVFFLGSDLTSVDSIADYIKGEIVDVTQALSVAAGANVAAGGYLRVTNSGLIQVDADGGGDEWVTLASIYGSGSVIFRYLSGGAATTVTLPRTAGNQPTAHSTASHMDRVHAVAGDARGWDWAPPDASLDILGAHLDLVAQL